MSGVTRPVSLDTQGFPALNSWEFADNDYRFLCLLRPEIGDEVAILVIRILDSFEDSSKRIVGGRLGQIIGSFVESGIRSMLLLRENRVGDFLQAFEYAIGPGFTKLLNSV